MTDDGQQASLGMVQHINRHGHIIFRSLRNKNSNKSSSLDTPQVGLYPHTHNSHDALNRIHSPVKLSATNQTSALSSISYCLWSPVASCAWCVVAVQDQQYLSSVVSSSTDSFFHQQISRPTQKGIWGRCKRRPKPLMHACVCCAGIFPFDSWASKRGCIMLTYISARQDIIFDNSQEFSFITFIIFDNSHCARLWQKL